MKHFLLTTGLLAASVSLTSAASVQQSVVKHADNIRMNTVTIHSLDKSAIRQLAPGVTLNTEHGMKRIHTTGREKDNTLTLNPQRRAPR